MKGVSLVLGSASGDERWQMVWEAKTEIGCTTLCHKFIERVHVLIGGPSLFRYLILDDTIEVSPSIDSFRSYSYVRSFLSVLPPCQSLRSTLTTKPFSSCPTTT